MIRRALLSVSDKAGLVTLARGLSQLGVELIATGGTAAALREAGLAVREVAELTGFPELLGGRVKTLHPALHAGLLARRDLPDQMAELEARGIDPIDLVAVNLYPFERGVGPDTPLEEALELIDIGGETLLRAAAKNFPAVLPVVDPADYGSVLDALESNGDLSPERRRALARKAFAHAARYNAAIASHFADDPLAEDLTLGLPRAQLLRYGENPDQRAALYGVPAEQLAGKGLSWTNVLDLDAAWDLARRFDRPACVIVKHATPCGAAVARSARLAFSAALAGDQQSAFGGVVGLNRPVGVGLARRLAKRFLEAVVAPEFSPEALETLKRKPNLRLLIGPERAPALEARSTAFGWMAQTDPPSTPLRLSGTTERDLTESQRRDARFGWAVVRAVKSNAVVLVREGATVGIGAGQMSRVDAVRMALWKAGERAQGAVLVSDGFFPFPDSIELAAEAGVEAVIQPGGSIRDDEVVGAADRAGLAMACTGRRAFRH